MKDEQPRPSRQDDAMLTRVTLIGKAKDQTNESAWSEFNSYYRKFIYNFVRRMGLSHHDTDEVVQMTLVKVWRAIPKFEYEPQKGKFRSWLCTIAGNTARNFIRSQGPVAVSLSDPEKELLSLETFAVEPEVERLAQEEWERYLPELALKNISTHFDRRTLQVFVLFTQGFTAAEIAEKLNLAESSVYVYKQRVKAKMTDEIARLQKELS